MVDDHKLRVECAEKFRDVEHLKNGRLVLEKALAKLTTTVETAIAERRVEYGELMRTIQQHHSEIRAAVSETNERVALVEASSRSAHRRLDTQQKMLWALVIFMITASGGALFKVLIG